MSKFDLLPQVEGESSSKDVPDDTLNPGSMCFSDFVKGAVSRVSDSAPSMHPSLSGLPR